MENADVLRFVNNLEPNKRYRAVMERSTNKDGVMHVLADHNGSLIFKLAIIDPDDDEAKMSYENRHK